MEKQEKKLSGVQPPPSGHVSVRMRSQLDVLLYRMANKEADEAVSASQLGEAGQEKELEASVKAIVLATMCLEAFINKVGLELEIWTNIPRIALEKKWVNVTRDLGRGNTFKPIKTLVRRRNYIVHYEAEMSPPRQGPTGGNVSELRATINFKSAAESTQVMKEMLVRFHSITNQKVPAWVV